MVKKRIVASFVLMALLVTFAVIFVGCEAQKDIELPEVKQDVYVYDQEGCIDDEIEAEINVMLKELEEKTEAEFAIVSVSSLNDYTIEEYAYKLFNALGVGKDETDNGVLLLFSKADGRVRLEIGRGLEGCLNDAKCGRILDDYFVPYREADDYNKATRNTVIAVITVIAEEYQVQLDTVGEAELADNKEDKMPTWIYIVVFVIVIVVAILKASDDDESYGGGYYGGVSSGGSFGGGRSGGGGASR